MQFKGHKLLVVGGTSGIGLETAMMVAEQGGAVVIVGNRPEKAEAARKQLAAVAGDDDLGALALRGRDGGRHVGLGCGRGLVQQDQSIGAGRHRAAGLAAELGVMA